MPTYEYECSRCGLITEEFKPMSAPARKRCPKCRSKVNRLISGGLGIVFKGSGFYSNDSKPKRSEPSADVSAKTAESGKSLSRTDSSSTMGGDKA